MSCFVNFLLPPRLSPVLFYEEGNALDTFNKPQGSTQIVFESNTECNITFVCLQENFTGATFK